MGLEEVEPRAGQIIDRINAVLARFQYGRCGAAAQLRVAKHLLLRHIEQRPLQAPATATAGLLAVEAALQEALDEISATEETPAVADDITTAREEVVELREAFEATSGARVESQQDFSKDPSFGEERWGFRRPTDRVNEEDGP